MEKWKITKEWINGVTDYRDKLKLHKDGSTLVLPSDMDIDEDIVDYAKTKRCEIVRGDVTGYVLIEGKGDYGFCR